jgi:hypothetical protein
MSQSIVQVIRDLEKTIPQYEMRKIDLAFSGIYVKNKLVSVVSSKYVLVQSRDLFKEVLENFKDFNILRHVIKTNLKKHFVYLRLEYPPLTEKFMVLLVNSIDRSNALKVLCGIFERECGNDLIVFSFLWLKHIGTFVQGILSKPFRNLIDPKEIIVRYENLKRLPNPLNEESIQKLQNNYIIYITEERKKELLALENALEVYRYITNNMAKKYNINYFEKLNYLYNFLIKA